MPIQLSHQVTNPPVRSSLAEGGKLTQITGPLVPILVCPFVPFHRLREDMNLLQTAGDQPTTAHRRKTSDMEIAIALSLPFSAPEPSKNTPISQGQQRRWGCRAANPPNGNGEFYLQATTVPSPLPSPTRDCSRQPNCCIQIRPLTFRLFFGKSQRSNGKFSSVCVNPDRKHIRTLQSLQFKFISILKALAVSLHKCHFLCKGRDQY